MHGSRPVEPGNEMVVPDDLHSGQKGQERYEGDGTHRVEIEGREAI